MALAALGWVIEKLFATAFKYRMSITRAFQERMSEIGMGLFIASAAEEEDTAADLLKMQEIIIRAYCKYLTLPCLYVMFGEEIIKTPHLDRFFSNFRSYNSFKEFYKRTGTTYNPTLPPEQQLTNLIKLTHIPGLVNALQTYINNPTQLWCDLSREIINWMNIKDKTKMEVMNYIEQKFTEPPEPIEDYLIHPMTILAIHPVIGLDWTVLKSYISTQLAYIDFFDSLDKIKCYRQHLWYGTRNWWLTVKKDSKEYKRVIDSTFVEPSDWIRTDSITVTAKRERNKIVQKEYHLYDPREAYFYNLDNAELINIKNFMPKSKRFFKTIKASEVFKDTSISEEDAKEVYLELEHEGVLSNPLKLIFMKNHLSRFSIQFYGNWDELTIKCIPSDEGIYSQGSNWFSVKKGYGIEIHIRGYNNEAGFFFHYTWVVPTKQEYLFECTIDRISKTKTRTWKVKFRDSGFYNYTKYMETGGWDYTLRFREIGAYQQTQEIERTEKQ